MGLISKTVIMKWNGKTKKHYISKGYTFTKMGDEFEVKIEDLSKGCNIYVDVQCDCPDCTTPINQPIRWVDYLKCVKEDGKYYCNKCSVLLYGKKKEIKTRLLNGKSFYDWCVEHERYDMLTRWDGELNGCSPKDITYGSSSKRYWFKCPQGIHPSELKNIKSFTNGEEGAINCNQCNSFAQWGIDNICPDFLEKYWDYEKNNELGINPFKIAKSSNIKMIWIKCQEKDYHGSYLTYCASFIKGGRCSYCAGRKIYPLDSLGQHIVDNYGKEFLDKIWSEKNKKSPFEYAPNSNEDVWWFCIDNNHKDYYRKISDSKKCNFRCPECQYSKGEKRIEEYLINNNFTKDIDYIPQMEFDGLIGLGNGNLSYDFYLPKFNLLIEYQGEMHERFVKGIHKSKKDFERQQEHDRRKREYADENDIKLLPIWYWDFDNIEKILNKELNINKIKEVI